MRLILKPDWDPRYHYHVNGKKVVITKEDWEKYKDDPTFKEVRATVEVEQAAHPEPEYEINPNFVRDLRSTYSYNMGYGYRNYSNFRPSLPQGYSFTNEGLIVDPQGNYYVQSSYNQSPRFTYNTDNPLQFTINKGKPIEKTLTFYPINMDKRLKEPLPVDKTLDIDYEKERAINNVPSNYEIPWLGRWYRYMPDWIDLTVKSTPTGTIVDSPIITKDEYDKLIDYLKESNRKHPEDFKDLAYDGKRGLDALLSLVNSGRWIKPSRAEVEKNAIISVESPEKVGTFAEGGRLISKYQNGAKLNLSIKYKVGDYYYTKNDGTIVIIPKEFYERNKGKSYWEGIENAVNTANDSFKQTVEDDYKLSGYQNYRNFNSYLPEGYSFRNSGLIVSSDGTYYVPSFYKETNRIGVNREASPLQFTIYQGKPIEKQLTYYPVYDRKPLDTTNNTIKVLTEDDFEKQYAPVRDFKSGNINIIRYYAPTNPQADTSGYVYKQVLQEPEPLYDWDNYNEESFKIYSNQLEKWFNAYLKSLENIQKSEIPEGFNTITEQTFKTLYSNADEHNKNLVKAKYDNPALVLKGKTLPVKYFPNGYGDYKKTIYLPDGTNNILSNGGKINNSFAKGGKLISKYLNGEKVYYNQLNISIPKIINPKYNDFVRQADLLTYQANLQNYRELENYLPEGYKFRNSGLIQGPNGELYALKGYHGNLNYNNPFTITFYKGKPILKDVLFYPINDVPEYMIEDDSKKYYRPIYLYFYDVNPNKESDNYYTAWFMTPKGKLIRRMNSGLPELAIFSDVNNRTSQAYKDEGYFRALTEDEMRSIYNNLKNYNKGFSSLYLLQEFPTIDDYLNYGLIRKEDEKVN